MVWLSVIERVEAYAVDPGYGVRWTEQHAGVGFVTVTIVKIIDSDGAEGVGCIGSYVAGRRDLSVLEALRSLAPALIGREAQCQEAVARELRVGVVIPFMPGPVAAFDIALWDLAARRANVPLYRMLGGARGEIPAYASLEAMASEDSYVETVARAKAQGIGAVKVHCWGDPERDIGLLRRLREDDPRLVLMHDAEGVYDRRSALHVAKELEALGAYWFEAPLPDYDLAGYRRLLDRVDVPILAAGYSMWDIRQFADALRDPPWSAVRCDVTATMGITSLRKLMLLAEAHDMNLEPVSYGHSLTQAASLHVALAHDNCDYFELPFPNEPWEFGIVNPIRPDSRGMVRAPATPGLGIEIDWETIESATIASVNVT